MVTPARSLLCAVPPPPAPHERAGRRFHRVLRALAVLGALVGIQGIVAGPAAEATLPKANARPTEFSILLQPATLGVSAGFVPDMGRTPGLFQEILKDAFPPRHTKKPVLREEPAETAGDPDELIPFGSRTIPRWLVHSILKAARVTGVDPVYMMTLADVESSLSPEAKAPTSSARGLFQFIDRTWLEIVYFHAADYGFTAAAQAIRMVDGDPVVAEKDREWVMNLRTDPYFSALMAGELIKEVERALQAQGERELAEAELYIAHFLGATSAVRFLAELDQNPDMTASKLFPKAAKANAGLFMEGKGRRRRAVSVAELYNKIDSKIVPRLDRYESIGPYLAEVMRSGERVAETE